MSIDLNALIKIKKFTEFLDLNRDGNMLNSSKDKKEVIKRYLEYVLEKKSNDKSKNDEYFQIYMDDFLDLSSDTKKNKYIKAFEKVFSEEFKIHGTYLKINKKYSELFIELCSLLKGKKKVNRLSKQIFFNWDFDNIDKGIYLDLWDWNELSKNPGIYWDFDFVEKYKDHLDWKYVKVNRYLNWDEELIEKYSEYIFSSESIENFKDFKNCPHSIGDYVNDYEFELNKNIKWSVSLIEKFSDKWNFKYLSYCLDINLPPSLIEQYIDKWDLNELQKNDSIKLEFSTIEILKDKLDWNYIITYKHLKWDEKTFDKFSTYIFSTDVSLHAKTGAGADYYHHHDHNYSGSIESNENVIWTESLIDKYKNYWNWDYLVKNPKIKFTSEQLDKYENYIDWRIFSEFGNTDWTEDLISALVEKNAHEIAKNPYIEWTDYLFCKYFKDKDYHPQVLSYFCENAKISNDIIIKNQTYWKTVQVPWQHYYKYSDETPYFDYTFNTLWRYLSLNRNIIWNDKLLESCLNNLVINEVFGPYLKLSVEFINKYWNLSKNETIWHTGSYKTGPYQEEEKIYLRDKIGYCEIINLDIEKLIINEYKWVDSQLINEYYINKSIENLILNENKK